MISDNKEIQEILKKTHTIAMIGCSPDPYRTSNYAMRYLQDKGYQVIPVNPHSEEIRGEKCYNRLADLPEESIPDLVIIFRNSKYSAEAVEDIAEYARQTGSTPVVWTQLDVSSGDAEHLAEDHQLPYVRNKCIMVEWDRLMG